MVSLFFVCNVSFLCSFRISPLSVSLTLSPLVVAVGWVETIMWYYSLTHYGWDWFLGWVLYRILNSMKSHPWLFLFCLSSLYLFSLLCQLYGLIYISYPLLYLQGVMAPKKDAFSLTSGDFPTLGSEKDISGKNTESQGYVC